MKNVDAWYLAIARRWHTCRMKSLLRCAAMLTLILGAATVDGSGVVAAPPAHLDWATSVAVNVIPANNAYGTSPTFLTWPGVAGSTIYSNRSECASFVTRVLKQAYGWSSTHFTTWMGSTSPTSAKYYDAIVAQNRFTRIVAVSQIAAGDIVAAKYLAPDAGVTGHLMIAASAATPRPPSAPIVVGTTQYEIQVIDSSKTGHGTTDTRRRADGTYEDGVGRGVLRLYVSTSGIVIGYSWSTLSVSVFYDASTRPLVIGRL